MISLGKSQGIAVQVRSRGFVQGAGIPDDIKMLYSKRLDTPKPDGGSGDWGPFHLKQHSFTEVSFSYGVRLLDRERHKFRMGVSLKYLAGGRTGFIEGNVDQLLIDVPALEDTLSELDGIVDLLNGRATVLEDNYNNLSLTVGSIVSDLNTAESAIEGKLNKSVFTGAETLVVGGATAGTTRAVAPGTSGQLLTIDSEGEIV